MFEFTTVARPYAKAAFDFAVEHKTVEYWQDMLTFAARVTYDESIISMLSGALAPETMAKIFIAAYGDQLSEPAQNFIRIMAENNRLLVFPEVLAQFIQLRDSLESTVDVEICSAMPLNDQQKKKIAVVMEKQLSRKVKLNCKIDSSVIAGVIIRAGDMVIDGSVGDRLRRLSDVLQS
ncbi:F0F1 ATP synthase subunit delta [Candidatus Regiella insecticola]|nr:F0F1 ATP synthase subunit delta [Candidatus Regiella insecticola]GFN45803.1 ATP synthase subunit delta [Candidatus Regiella insecticola]